MNIEVIIFFVIWVVSMEIIFFKYTREDSSSFLENKFIAILGGLLLAVLVFGLPAFIANVPPAESGEAVGNIAYVWYYGIACSLALIILINYKISEWLDERERNRWRTNSK